MFDTPGEMASAVDSISGDLFPSEEPKNESSTPEADAGESSAAAPAVVAEAAPEPAPAAEVKPEQAAMPAPPTPPASAAPDLNVAPKTWRPEAAAEWAALPEKARAEIVKREEDMYRGLEAYREDAGFGKTVKQVLNPYLPTMKQYGVDPMQQVDAMMRAHHTLAFGTPEQKQGLLRQIIADYRLDATALANEAADAPYIDPAVRGLQSELQSVKSKIEQSERQAFEAKRTETVREIERFYADPKNPYAAEVSDEMASLIQSGKYSSLADAYQAAIWLNPGVRAKELARLDTERQSAARKTAEEEAARAKKALEANVRSSTKRASQTAATGSLDDTLKEAYQAIQSRH